MFLLKVTFNIQMYKWDCVNNCNKHDWGSFWHMDYCKTLSQGLNRVIKSMYEYSVSGQDDGIDYKQVLKDAEVLQDFLKREKTNILLMAADLIDQHDEWLLNREQNEFK